MLLLLNNIGKENMTSKEIIELKKHIDSQSFNHFCREFEKEAMITDKISFYTLYLTILIENTTPIDKEDFETTINVFRQFLEVLMDLNVPHSIILNSFSNLRKYMKTNKKAS